MVISNAGERARSERARDDAGTLALCLTSCVTLRCTQKLEIQKDLTLEADENRPRQFAKKGLTTGIVDSYYYRDYYDS
jgi:hypothetical protein